MGSLCEVYRISVADQTLTSRPYRTHDTDGTDGMAMTRVLYFTGWLLNADGYDG